MLMSHTMDGFFGAAELFRFDAFSPYLPRIPDERGLLPVAFGKAVITPQRRSKRAPQGSPQVFRRP